MRFTLYEPTALSVHHLVQLAQEAERLGFDAFSLNDGTFQMKTTRGVYPYSQGNRPNWDLEAPFYEPMTILPAIAMQTKTINIFPSVIKLPLHHPLPLAKQVATAAVMSNDRFALGVGASWAPEEYEFCRVDWHKRGKIMTESIEVLRLVLSGEWVEYHGEIFDFDPIIARPVPRKPVKIYIGGHHEPSLKRAARLADGWIAAGPARSPRSRPTSTACANSAPITAATGRPSKSTPTRATHEPSTTTSGSRRSASPTQAPCPSTPAAKS